MGKKVSTLKTTTVEHTIKPFGHWERKPIDAAAYRKNIDIAIEEAKSGDYKGLESRLSLTPEQVYTVIQAVEQGKDLEETVLRQMGIEITKPFDVGEGCWFWAEDAIDDYVLSRCKTMVAFLPDYDEVYPCVVEISD